MRTLFAALWLALPAAAVAAEAATPAAPAAPATPSGKTEITWLGHSAFVVRTPKGLVLAIDPWLKNPQATGKDLAAKTAKVDYILLSHGHQDHVGDTVELAEKTGAKLVATSDLARNLVAALGFPQGQAGFETTGNVGGPLVLDEEVTVAMVPAIHGSELVRDQGTPTLPGGNPVGFVIKIKGGPTILHTGDTDVYGDMKLVAERYAPTVMICPIGGHFTMDPKGAAIAASYLKPKTIIPMHFGTFPVLTGRPAEFAKELKARGVKAQLMELQVGETRTF